MELIENCGSATMMVCEGREGRRAASCFRAVGPTPPGAGFGAIWGQQKPGWNLTFHMGKGSDSRRGASDTELGSLDGDREIATPARSALSSPWPGAESIGARSASSMAYKRPPPWRASGWIDVPGRPGSGWLAGRRARGCTR